MEKILQINCTATDFYQEDAFPTYLYYNPYDTVKSVCFYNTDKIRSDLYDVLSHTYLGKDVGEEMCFDIPAKSARLIVVVPAGSKMEVKDSKYTIGPSVVAYIPSPAL